MFHAESPAGRMMKIGFERMTVERKRQIQVLQLIACDHDRIGPARRRAEKEEEEKMEQFTSLAKNESSSRGQIAAQ